MTRSLRLCAFAFHFIAKTPRRKGAEMICRFAGRVRWRYCGRSNRSESFRPRLRQVEQENAQLKIAHQRLVSQVSQAKQADALSLQQQQHKLPTSDTKAPSLPLGVTDLGVVELSNRTPMRLDLGEGKECVVTTTVLDDGQLQMVFASESKSPEGLTIQKEHTVTVLPDRQIIISALDAVVSLTPTLKTK